jgi:hypothetical protein
MATNSSRPKPDAEEDEDDDDLLHVGETGHAGLAVQLGLLCGVGVLEGERLDKLCPRLVIVGQGQLSA